MFIEILFWVLLGTILYSFIGYTLVLMILRCFIKPGEHPLADELPRVTLFIAAYNERDVIEAKIANSNALNYPKGKLEQLWVTDGSDDQSQLVLQHHAHLTVLHQEQRNGKIGAI